MDESGFCFCRLQELSKPEGEFYGSFGWQIQGHWLHVNAPKYRPVVRAVLLPGLVSSPGSIVFCLASCMEVLPLEAEDGPQQAPDLAFSFSSLRAKRQFSGMALGEKTREGYHWP